MKLIAKLLVFVAFLSACGQGQGNEEDTKISQIPVIDSTHPILGNWIRNGHQGAVRINFKDNGSIDLDFGNNKNIETLASFSLSNDTLFTEDIKGAKCNGKGVYKVYFNPYYIAFDLIEDNCNDRIKTMMGFWTRSGHQEMLDEIAKKLTDSPNPELNLARARVNLALGKASEAQSDFDIYIESDTTNARAYINRAATYFPSGFEDIIADCDKAISLEPQNKNAYFLRGLARYELGQKEIACEDFHTAIQLGFTILKIAEQRKCSEIWKKASY